ncbi:separin protein [Scheffersomyces coipomensis]|uniref:separin protein n=1 Tax=Scheffersomyces coipomensis TaxID=1788519 RepID=UPI00315DAAD9
MNVSPQSSKDLFTNTTTKIDAILSTTISVNDIEIASNCFKYLHSNSMSSNHSIASIKKHQMFIIKLIEIKQYATGINELNHLNQAFNNLVNRVPINWSQSVDSSLIEIPFNGSVPETDVQLINLIVAYHFLYLQCLLQSISHNLKLVASNKDPQLNLSVFKYIPVLFLNSSHFSNWLKFALEVTPVNKEKYHKNCIKITNGYMVILDTLMKKIKSIDLKMYKTCLRLKFVEFTGEKFDSWDIATDGYVAQFLNDLKNSDYPYTSSILEQVQPASIDDLIVDLQEFSKQPTSMLLNQLQVKFLANSNVINDSRILHSITSVCLQNNDISYSFIHLITAHLSSQSEAMDMLSKGHFQILDHFTIFLKAISKNVTNITTLKLIMADLQKVFYHFRQVKRIRNLSNILYNIGNICHDEHIMALCIAYEIDIYDITQAKEDFNTLKTKVQKISNTLCEVGSAQKSTTFIKVFLDFAYRSKDKSIVIDNIFLQLLAKCISADLSVGTTIFGENSYDDTFKSSILIKQFELLERSTNPDIKTKVINHLYQSASFQDENVRCLISYHYYKINGLTEVIDLSKSPNGNNLFKCGYYLQKLINSNWDDTLFKESIHCMLNWLNDYHSIESDYLDYENDIFRSLILYLKFNGATGYIINVIDNYITARKELSNEMNLFIQYQYCDCLMKFALYSDVSESLLTLNTTLKESKINALSEVVAFNLLQLDYFINVKDFPKAMEKFNKIHKVFASRGEYNLISNENISTMEKLQNLLLISKFQLAACKINLLANNPIEAVKNARVSIKIAYSIIKKSGPNIKRNTYNEIKWETTHVLFESYKYIITTLSSLGITRDFLFYLNEFEKTNDSTVSPIVNCLHNFDILFYHICLLKDDELSNYLTKAEGYSQSEIVSTNINVNYKGNNIKGLLNSQPSEFRLPKFNSKLDITNDELLNIFRLDNDENSVLHHTLSLKTQPNFNFTLNNKHTELLDILVVSKIQLANTIKEIGQIPQLNSLHQSVQSLPNIVGDGLTNSIIDNIPILNKLVQLKDDLFKFVSHPQFKSLAAYQIKDLSSTITKCLMLISSMSNFKSNTNILHELYYLQDFPRALPFKNDRSINHTSTGAKEILPSQIEPQPIFDFHSRAVEFNIDLNLYLPDNWSIVTLDICNFTGDLVISKFTKGSHPHYINLPILRSNNTEQMVKFDDLKKNFNDIIKQSDISTKASTTSKIFTKEQRKNWWKLRFHLDLRMKDLLESVEKNWVGGFKGIFSTFAEDAVFTKFKQDFIKLILGLLPSRHISDERYMKFDDKLIGLFYNLSSYDRLSVDDLFHFLIDSLNFHAETNNYEEIMIAKFHKNFELLFDKYFNLRSNSVNEHLVLVPGSSCSFFPWESLGCFAGKSVSRVPSVELLIDMLKNRHSKTVDKSSLYYIINPGGDLRRTEEKFRPMFSKQRNWNGLTGSKPNEENLMQNIAKTDLFVYLGHGGCDQYIKTSTLFKTCLPNGPKLPPSLLIGCSSGALSDNGIFEHHGNVYNWLTCGAPMVLVNLWDVTDKDIDQFSLSVFEKWGILSNQPRIKQWNISEAVGTSRNCCTLPYLNGSAPIVYGLPLVIKQ